MTSEITLRGLVLPVGGIEEKVPAAHRAGVKTIISPRWNEKDLADVSPKVPKEIRLYFVGEMIEVLKIKPGVRSSLTKSIFQKGHEANSVVCRTGYSEKSSQR